MQRVVVGIDPGTTTAIAVVSLSREVQFVGSVRNGGVEQTVAMIKNHGTPIVIATDKNPAPTMVIEIARAFNARLYVPPHNLTTVEKQQLSAHYATTNVHEIDALSAALKFFKMYENKLRWLIKETTHLPPHQREEVVALVMSGIALHDALFMIHAPSPHPLPPHHHQEKTPLQKSREEAQYRARICTLLKQYHSLKTYAEHLEAEVHTLRAHLVHERNVTSREVKFHREIRKRDMRIRILEEEIANLRKKLAEAHAKIHCVQKENAPHSSQKNEEDTLRSLIDEYRKKRREK